MGRFYLAASLLAYVSLAFGQQDTNALTITASRRLTVEPDEAVFAITVSSSRSTGLDQVVAALQGTGVTAANLSSVNSVDLPSFKAPNVMALEWSFVLPVPLKTMKSTVAALAALEQNISQNAGVLGLSFNLAGTQASPELLQSQQCPIGGLLADATAQAQQLAAASRLVVGPVVALAQPSVSAGPAPILEPSPYVFATLSQFVVAAHFYRLVIPETACSITVKFSLLRYH